MCHAPQTPKGFYTAICNTLEGVLDMLCYLTDMSGRGVNLHLNNKIPNRGGGGDMPV
jgi:hypothetical protein